MMTWQALFSIGQYVCPSATLFRMALPSGILILLSVITPRIVKFLRRIFYRFDLVRRETSTPRQQYIIEKVTLGALRASHILSRKRYFLPVEIWVIILDEATTPPFIFDTTCSSDEFLRFCDKLPFTDFRKTQPRRNLRQVCRLWREILDEKKQKWQVLDSSGLIRQNAKRIDFSPNTRARISWHRLKTDMWIYKLPRNSLVTISLRLTLTSSDEPAFLEKLFELGPTLQNLRVLHIYLTYSSSTSSFSKIETSFPNLTVLSLESSSRIALASTLHHENLRVLNLRYVYGGQLNTWRFPSLEHLQSDQAIWEFVTPHAMHLRSLSVFHTVWLDENFWQKFPLLEHLSLIFQTNSLSSPPPPDHPLRMISWQNKHEYYPFSTITSLAQHLPKGFRINVGPRQKTWPPDGPVLKEALEICKQKEVKVFDHNGMECKDGQMPISEKPPPEDVWAAMFFLAAVAIYFTFLPSYGLYRVLKWFHPWLQGPWGCPSIELFIVNIILFSNPAKGT